MKRLSILVLASLMEWPFALTAGSPVIITEFMASNTITNLLADEDGETSDWIELHNAGPDTVNLDGWFLTDTCESLARWRFPTTNLTSGGYMVVFASGKDRRVPGRPLHTNFRLSGSGEYLALVEPDGVTKATEFAPSFPPQTANVSFGLAHSIETQRLIATNSPIRVWVSSDDVLDPLWTTAAWDDSGWLSGANGVGYDRGSGASGMNFPFRPLIATDFESALFNRSAGVFVRIPFSIGDPAKIEGLRLQIRYDDGFAAYVNGVLAAHANAPLSGPVADSSLEFSGIQGLNNWSYGYYHRSADANGTYETNDFTLFPDNYWTGALWDWPSGNPPWTSISANGGCPNGSNSGHTHWAVRRWRSEVAGTVVVRVRLAKSNVNCGSGTTGRIFQNGVEKFALALAFNDAVGVVTEVTLTDVAVGDAIDFAIDPTGADAQTSDSCDGTIFTAQIDSVIEGLNRNTLALTNHPNALGQNFEEFDLHGVRQWLTAGTNILAVHGLNVSNASPDFFIQPVLVGMVLTSFEAGTRRYFTAPTPGSANGVGVADLGPIITEASHTPATPSDAGDIVVTARIVPAFSPIASNSLVYRVMFGSEVTLPLRDDGKHGDGTAGDGVFGAIIPASAVMSGQMIRWYMIARDQAGRTSRWPIFADPNRSPEYLGTVVADPTLTNPLPVLHWFVESVSATDTDAGTRASLFYLGEFYDNVLVNLHGQSSRMFPKKSYDFEFNPGHEFRYDPNQSRVSDINCLTTYPDKAHMRNILAYEIYRDAGSPYHFVYPARAQRNAHFWGDVHLVENGDSEYVARVGSDPSGALYKMYNNFNTSPDHARIALSNAEKKTRKSEDNADLLAFLNGVLLTGESLRMFLYDNVDLPQILNTLAARVITGDQDCCHKNYYLYRDSLGNREWQFWPWDVDLSFGRRYSSTLTYWDDTMVIDTSTAVGMGNGLVLALYTTPEIRQMYWRRLRTLMDELLQAPGTPTDQLKIERRIDEWVPRLAPDAALDLAKHGTWGNGAAQSTCCIQSLQQASDLIKHTYLPQRRAYLFQTKIVTAGGEIPLVQPTDVVIAFTGLDFNPASGRQTEEYIQLTNANDFAVDITGWKLTGGIDFTFKPGTVIPSRGTLFVSPDVNAFRARATGPHGGQSCFVQGNYQGQLSARGETVRLINPLGIEVNTLTYTGNPSLAQRDLRITELMYHPAPMPRSPNSAEAFEFIELKNIGPSLLDLRGVRLTHGIDFAFTGSAVTNLDPGQSVLVVKDQAAFTTRYGTGFLIAGQYAGFLENSGERLRLLDRADEEILDFDYNHSWYPVTDGLGFSLGVVDEHAEPDQWSSKTQWRPSGSLNGTPGQSEATAPVLPPIRINEALTRSEAPTSTDSIELFNPTSTNVNIGGWFLTDDFNTPAKFRIPSNTIIFAGGYLVFTEADFNPSPGVPPSFALSSNGDELYLFSGNAQTNLTGYVHGFDFSPAEDGVSFGRQVTSDGREHFVPQAALSLGAKNAGPRVGPVVIHEIMYHPPKLTEGGNDVADEFIELRNVTMNAVTLYDPWQPTNTWKLTGGVDYQFPTNLVLDAGGWVLLVNFDPTNLAQLSSFRARHGVPTERPVLGPYGGKLNNDGDRIELKRPEWLDAMTWACVTVDRVDYRDSAPWPEGADGFGLSLQRRDPVGFGNEPTNWLAALPTARALTLSGGNPPIITAQPVSQAVFPLTNVTFSVRAWSSTPLRYQWRQAGANLSGATNTTYSLTHVLPTHSGAYSVLVADALGTRESDIAQLTVYGHPLFTKQPTNTTTAIGNAPINVTLRSLARSGSPVRYQWQFNGNPLAGASNANLTISNVQTFHAGSYTVEASDSFGSITSAPALLTVMVPPSILVQPISQSVVSNGTATFTIRAVGTSPFSFRWRRNGVTFTDGFALGSGGTCFLSLPRVQFNHAGKFSVEVTNMVGSVLSSNAILTVLADSDGDGLPDAWEALNGFNVNDPLDGRRDDDGDRMSNAAEYVAGTDHRNPTSYLRVDRATSDSWGLSFLAVSNRSYTVEYSDSLNPAQWQRLAEVPARTNSRLRSVPDSTPGGSRFYRVVTPVQP